MTSRITHQTVTAVARLQGHPRLLQPRLAATPTPVTSAPSTSSSSRSCRRTSRSPAGHRIGIVLMANFSLPRAQRHHRHGDHARHEAASKVSLPVVGGYDAVAAAGALRARDGRAGVHAPRTSTSTPTDPTGATRHVPAPDRHRRRRPEPGRDLHAGLRLALPGRLHARSPAPPDATGNTATTTFTVLAARRLAVGGTVAATLASRSAPGVLRRVHAGRHARTYTAPTTANVISTAGDAALTVADPRPGHLVNGTFAAPAAAAGRGSNRRRPWTYAAPVSNAAVAIGFTQLVGHRRAAHRHLQQDAHVHAVDHDPLGNVAQGPRLRVPAGETAASRLGLEGRRGCCDPCRHMKVTTPVLADSRRQMLRGAKLVACSPWRSWQRDRACPRQRQADRRAVRRTVRAADLELAAHPNRLPRRSVPTANVLPRVDRRLARAGRAPDHRCRRDRGSGRRPTSGRRRASADGASRRSGSSRAPRMCSSNRRRRYEWRFTSDQRDPHRGLGSPEPPARGWRPLSADLRSRRRQRERQRLRVRARAQRVVGADRLLEADRRPGRWRPGRRRSAASSARRSRRPARRCRWRSSRTGLQRLRAARTCR